MNQYPASSPDPSAGFGPTQPPAVPSPASVSLRLPSAPPRVTYSVLGVTVLVYIVQLLTPNFYSSLDLPTFLGAKINELIRAGQIWRLITPILLHDHTNLLHIGFNMYALIAIGPGLERRFGHGRFLVLYLLGGFAGNVFSFLFSNGISIGASTSIMGLIAAEGIFLYQNRELFGKESKQAIGNVVFIVVINLVIGFSSGGYIDNWGHIGGLLGGAIFTWFAGPVWEVEGLYPLVHLVDRRALRETILGAGVVLLVFGVLAILGLIWPIV